MSFCLFVFSLPVLQVDPFQKDVHVHLSGREQIPPLLQPERQIADETKKEVTVSFPFIQLRYCQLPTSTCQILPAYLQCT